MVVAELAPRAQVDSPPFADRHTGLRERDRQVMEQVLLLLHEEDLVL
jgi:hypothetical protein